MTVMKRTDSIIDDIDRLIDEQLAAGEDFGSEQHDVCGHCGREWHGLAITQRIVGMRILGEYDEDYRYAEDNSEVLCPGSGFIGPRAPTRWDREHVTSPVHLVMVSIGFTDHELPLPRAMPYAIRRSPNAEGLVVVGPGGGGRDWRESGIGFRAAGGGVGVMRVPRPLEPPAEWREVEPADSLGNPARPSYGVYVVSDRSCWDGHGIEGALLDESAVMTWGGQRLTTEQGFVQGDDLYADSEGQ